MSYWPVGFSAVLTGSVTRDPDDWTPPAPALPSVLVGSAVGSVGTVCVGTVSVVDGGGVHCDCVLVGVQRGRVDDGVHCG